MTKEPKSYLSNFVRLDSIGTRLVQIALCPDNPNAVEIQRIFVIWEHQTPEPKKIEGINIETDIQLGSLNHDADSWDFHQTLYATGKGTYYVYVEFYDHYSRGTQKHTSVIWCNKKDLVLAVKACYYTECLKKDPEGRFDWNIKRKLKELGEWTEEDDIFANDIKAQKDIVNNLDDKSSDLIHNLGYSLD